MITRSMTAPEIWENIRKDEEEIILFLSRQESMILRQVREDQKRILHKKDYPYYFAYQFTTRTKNIKVIIVEIWNKRALKDYKTRINYQDYTLQDRGKDGIYVYSDTQNECGRHLGIYTPHFWSRYRQRMNLDADMSFRDLLRNYYRHNRSYTVTTENVPVLKHRENEFFSTCAQGICFGIILDKNIYQFNTFITKQMLKGEKQMETSMENEVNRLLIDQQFFQPQFRTDRQNKGITDPLNTNMLDAIKRRHKEEYSDYQVQQEKLEKEMTKKEAETKTVGYKLKKVFTLFRKRFGI